MSFGLALGLPWAAIETALSGAASFFGLDFSNSNNSGLGFYMELF